MKSCFVIQPFDGGAYDARFDDTFKLAIEAADLLPYRVDRDPRVDIPIEEIEKKILEAAVCFAEISTDNPNVWFELGYAIASKKPVCMVCSSERPTDFPFDIQHRNVIKYDVRAPRDFKKAGEEITTRLKAIIEKQQEIQMVISPQSAKATVQSTVPSEGLRPHELTALALINSSLDIEGISVFYLQRKMEEAGYTEIATGVAFQSLLLKHLIEQYSGDDGHYNPVTFCRATKGGIEWLLRNQGNLSLHLPPPHPGGSSPIADDDIPF